MTALSKLTISLIVIVLGVLAVAGQVVHVRQRINGQSAYTTNSGQLVSGVFVGQTFVAEKNNLSAVAVQFATYSNRSNTKDVELHLLASPTDKNEIRTGKVNAGKLRDNQMYRFDFAPIPDSKGKTYFFYLASPQSVPGNAVTVDMSTQDPYFRGTAYVARTNSPEYDGTKMAGSGKLTVDVTFEVFETVLMREAVAKQATVFVRTLVGTWPEKKNQYSLYALALGQALVVLGTVFIVKKRKVVTEVAHGHKKSNMWVLLIVLFLMALVFRYLYARDLPITDDEGNYLYDAATLFHKHLAGGDGYVKAPLVIAWVALFQLMVGNTVMAGRLASIVISALTIFPLYALAKELWGKRVGLVSASLWASAGSAVVYGIYVHTQPLALFFGVAGLAVLLLALRGHTPRLTFFTEKNIPSVGGWFFLSGVLLGLGVASRKSMLALGLVPLLLIGVEGKNLKLRLRHVLMVGAGFLTVITLFLAVAYWVYGWVGVQEAIGLNSAEDSVATVDPDEVEKIRAYSLHGMTPFFRESLPLIFGVLLGLGLVGERLVQYVSAKLFKGGSKTSKLLVTRILPKLMWIGAFAVFAWAWNFFISYEGQVFMFWGIPQLWFLFALIGLMAMASLKPVAYQELAPVQHTVVAKSAQITGTRIDEERVIAALERKKTRLQHYIVAFFLVPLWVGGLAFFYVHWIKFHANYISEFIPPLVLLSGYGLVKVWSRFTVGPFFVHDHPFLELARRIGIGLVAGVLLWALFVSNYITHVFEHTGTFDHLAVAKAATWAKENIPADQVIFTGASLVPYVSSHRTALDIAHPRWYAYEFIRTNTKRMNTFLPPVQDMIKAFGQANWVLVDNQTQFSFFNEYDVISQGVAKDFIPVQVIENNSNELTFYRRIHK